MKILFAPSNIASMPAITANAMNNIEGIEAKYFTIIKHQYLTENNCAIKVFPFFKPSSFKKNPFQFLLFHIEMKTIYKIKLLYKLLKWIYWCDVVHWTWGSIFPFQLDIKMAKFFNKKRFIEWIGSDIRVPEVTMEESKWYAEAFNNGYEYQKIENIKISYKRQESFKKQGFIPILVPEMQLFLKPNLFPKVFTTQYRIFEKDKYIKPFFPKLENKKIIIVHSPSAKIAKGSNIIIPIVEELKKSYPIEFIILHGVSREKVINTMQQCDIFIDQIILGSYAAAAIEAMGLGKPTVAYIMPSVYKKGIPIDCPIVNANPDTLKEKLIELIENPKLRYQVGVKSREYVESFHNVDILSNELISIYKSFK